MKKRILVVDDEPAFSLVFRRALPDYEIRAECDPKLAIDAAEEFHPDVLLLDLVMPDIPGLLLAKILACHPVLGDIPIIFVSAMVQDRGQGDGPVWIGPHPAFGKPFSLFALKQCIAEQMEHRQLSAYPAPNVKQAVIAGM